MEYPNGDTYYGKVDKKYMPNGDGTWKKKWEQYYDDVVKAKYWYNAKTGEATWIEPKKNNGLKLLSQGSQPSQPSQPSQGGKKRKSKRKHLLLNRRRTHRKSRK